MRALVTGGAGFIGSNLVDALLDAGHEVTVLDDLSTGRRENLDDALARGARLDEADIRDATSVEAAFAAARPEWVFHLAAQVDVRRSVAETVLDVEINVAGTVQLLEAARVAGVRRFVFSSTGGALYGDVAGEPAGEDAPVRPESPYGQAKHAAEGYCELYGRLHHLSTVILRYANVYGPRQDPLGEGGVVAIFCGRRLAGGRPTVFGDGLQSRDYVHVADVVAANLAAATADAGGTYNIGTGIETTVLELVALLRGADAANGAEWTPEHAPIRAGEVRRSVLAVDAAAQGLGWRPRIGLRDGLRSTLASIERAGRAPHGAGP